MRHAEDFRADVVGVFTQEDGTLYILFSSGQFYGVGVIVTQLAHIGVVEFPVEIVVI